MHPDPEADRDPGRDGTAAERAIGARGADGVALTSTLVRYDGRPDRVTVHPVNPGPEERLTAWVTVDHDAVCDLTAMR